MSAKIFSLIPKVMAEVGAIAKSGYNAYDKYKFRSIDDVYSKLQPALSKHGVFFVPFVLDSKEERITSSKDKEMLRVKIRVRYDVFADDGSTFSTVVEGEAIDRGDKATNKALTAAFKYMLIQVFCLAVEGQDDADKESHDLKPKKQIVSPLDPPDRSTYVIPFGKFKGLKIEEVDGMDLASYVNYITKESEKKGTEIKGQVKEFIDLTMDYLNSKNEDEQEKADNRQRKNDYYKDYNGEEDL